MGKVKLSSKLPSEGSGLNGLDVLQQVAVTRPGQPVYIVLRAIAETGEMHFDTREVVPNLTVTQVEGVTMAEDVAAVQRVLERASLLRRHTANPQHVQHPDQAEMKLDA